MMTSGKTNWEVTPKEAVEVQRQLRDSIVTHPPAGFAPRTVAGADVSITRGSRIGYAGIVVLDAETLEEIESAGVARELTFPYIPGLLSFRELPVLAPAWEALKAKPDVLLFDGHGYAHPRRFGLACYGGVLFDVPSIGVAKTILVGEHGPLAHERGATAELVHRGEVVGMAVRTREGVNPIYVSIGHLMDLPTAVELVLMVSRYREPETTRSTHQLVNRLRRQDLE